MTDRPMPQPDFLQVATFIDLDLTNAIFQQVLDAMSDLVLIKGPKPRLLWANKAFCALYGMSNEQLRGIIDAPFNEPDFTQQYVKDDAYVFVRGEVLEIPEEPVTRHDGGLRFLHTVKYPLRNAAGEVIATFGVSQDITDKKRLAAQDLAIREQQFRLERQQQELALSEQQHLIERQSEVIRALSTPIIEIWDGVLTLPMLGVVDSIRAAAVMERLLTEVSQKRARFAILDLTGVSAVDTSTANHLLKLIQALRLLGAEGIITGIQPTVAQTMITLGVDLASVVTCGNLRQGLRFCMARSSEGAERQGDAAER
jgi:PAS domain S-box-containing protein